MKDYIQARVVEVANYIVATNCTVRQAGKHFCLSKSTVHKDMQQRLPEIDKALWLTVNQVLKVNFNERHLRGGQATQSKYLKMNKVNNK